ncbi:hypothetical protein LCGC14_2524550 [marine sediment metagenome]|uniref:Uncharacterized protein n=1 Tax=marine sediment metagenome TaxID=412755 RepID=A0A0F9AVS6_9ZZZZ
MAQILRQSTAVDIRLGPFVDVGDGFTPETGVTLAAANEKAVLKAAGAAVVTMAGAFAAVSGCDGYYDYTASVGDLNTCGDVTFVMQEDATYLPVKCTFQVVEEEVYDDLFAASAVGYLKPVTGGNDLDVTATGAAGIDWGNIENPTTAVDLSGTDIQLVDTCTVNTDMVGTNSALLAASAPANFGDLAITVTTGLVNITQAAADKVWSTASRILTASTNFNDIAAGDVWAVDATTQQTQGTFGQAIGDPIADTSTIWGLANTNLDATITSRHASGAAVASVSGNVDGNVTGSVGSIATGGIAALSFAAGAIDTSAIAANALTSTEVADSATPRILKNTALANFMFLVVDSTDHFTPKTGLTYVTGDSQRTIDGAAFANTTNLPTEVGFGIYKVSLSAADLNGDVITFKFSKAGSDTRLVTMLTQPT